MAYGGYSSISHLRLQNRAACKNGNFAVTMEIFRSIPAENQCKRCAAKVAKMPKKKED